MNAKLGKVPQTTYCSSRKEESPDMGFNRCDERSPKRKRMIFRIETSVWNVLKISTHTSLKVAH